MFGLIFHFSKCGKSSGIIFPGLGEHTRCCLVYHYAFINSLLAWGLVVIPMSKLEGKFLDSSFMKVSAYHEGTEEVANLENTSEYWKPLSETPAEQAEGSGAEEIETPESRNDDECNLASSASRNKIFSCPVEGCTNKFQYEGNLARHIIVGKHKFALERETTIDFVQKNYQASLSQSNLNSIRKAQQELLESFPTTDATLGRGWALKASRLVAKFKPNQRQYLVDKFEEGRRKGVLPLTVVVVVVSTIMSYTK